MPRTPAIDLSYISEPLRGLAVPIDQVRHMEDNARKHPERNIEATMNSLREFGQQKPIVLDVDGNCIAGNGTLISARRLGWTHIAVQHSTLSGDRARAYAIADNRAGDLGEFDPNILREFFTSVSPALRTVAGFTNNEVSELLPDLNSLMSSGSIEPQSEGPAPGVSWDDIDGSGERTEEDDSGGDDGASEAIEQSEESGTPQPTIRYILVFSSVDQQTRFHEFLRKLRTKYPDDETNADRVDHFITDTAETWNAE